MAHSSTAGTHPRPHNSHQNRPGHTLGREWHVKHWSGHTQATQFTVYIRPGCTQAAQFVPKNRGPRPCRTSLVEQLRLLPLEPFLRLRCQSAHIHCHDLHLHLLLFIVDRAFLCKEKACARFANLEKRKTGRNLGKTEQQVVNNFFGVLMQLK